MAVASEKAFIRLFVAVPRTGLARVKVFQVARSLNIHYEVGKM